MELNMGFVIGWDGTVGGGRRGQACVSGRVRSAVSMSLSSKERAELRSIAGRREMVKELATLYISESGPADGFREALDDCLAANELVKLKMKVKKKKEAKAIADELVGQVNAEVVIVTGHTAVVYRPAEKPKIALKASSSAESGKSQDSYP